jgi:hypothetical protein
VAGSSELDGVSARREADGPDVVRLVINAIREGFTVVRALGLRVTPPKLRILEVFPTAILVDLLQAWIGTSHFEMVASSHALAALDEMQCLAREFRELARKSNVRTPVIDRLREACEAFEPTTPRIQHLASAPHRRHHPDISDATPPIPWGRNRRTNQVMPPARPIRLSWR